jgi:hypothetical protein
MSGPIVRRYGFPNFEKIFGERELKHGAESESSTPSASSNSDSPAKPNPGVVPTKEETNLPKT